MELTTNDEDTVQKLCAEANAECDKAKLRDVRSRLGAFLHEHPSILNSMSEDTYQALQQLSRFGVRHPGTQR